MTASTLDDDQLFATFDDASIAPDGFRHREHVRAAFVYLRRHGDFAAGAAYFRAALARFAEKNGALGILHETITWAYLSLVHERMCDWPHDNTITSDDFVDAHPELLDHRNGAFASLYDVQKVTTSALARRTFLLPQRVR